MSSTVWIKLHNSSSGSELSLQDDYVHLTRVLPDLGKDCKKMSVTDINEFVNYDEASAEFSEEMPDAGIANKYVAKKMSDLIITLTALENCKSDGALNDIVEMKAKCKENINAFDLVELIYIL